MANKIQLRRDTSTNWTSTNPTLSQGEAGYETDTGYLKVGDGTTAWTSLGYFTPNMSIEGLNDVNAMVPTDGQVLTWDNTNSRWDTATPSYYTDSDVDTHLNTGTATTDQVLSWSGTDYVWVTSSGGSSLELYAENPSTPTAPSATGANAVAIGSESVSSGTNSTALGDSNVTGSNALAAGISNNTATYGARNNNSIAFGYLSRTIAGYFAAGNSASADGASSIAIGNSATASNTNAISIGAFTNAGSSATALGYRGKATALRSFGVNNNVNGGATGDYSIAIGDTCLASADSAVAIGFGSQADAANSVVVGSRGHAQGVSNRYAYSGASITGSNDGASQYGLFVLISDTTDATAEALTTNNSTASTTNQIILPNNSAYAFHGTIVARQQASAGTASAAWKVEGLIRREGTAGTATLVASTVTAIDNTPAWGMALSADTTNGGLTITATGAAATNIRWVATIHTSEVTYA